jgi:uncharacterized protein (TIGR02145 family)
MKKLLLLSALLIFACSSDDNDIINAFDNTQIFDIDGNLYPLQLIADEVWSTQNLRTKTYRDGSPIPYVEDPVEWENLTTGAWRYVNNDPTTEEKYGLLYNFYAVNNPKGLSPEGTRIPSYSDFLHLTSFFGAPLAGATDEEIFLGFLADDSENPWERNGNTIIGTNVTGFNLYPAGLQRSSISSDLFGFSALIWSSDAFTSSYLDPFAARWSYNGSTFTIGTFSTQNYYGCSVRLIKN